MNTIEEKQRFELQPVQTLKGVGPSVAAKLAKLGIFCVQDILFHLPLRYEDRTKITSIAALKSGSQGVIEGVIEHSEVRFGGRRNGRSSRTLQCYFSDDTGSILLRFFHFNKAQQAVLTSGVRLRCFGDVRAGKSMLEMTHPEYRTVTESKNDLLEDALTPVYPLSEGIHQTLLRKLAAQVLMKLNSESVTDWIPEAILEKNNFPSITDAIKTLHRPPPDIDYFQLANGSHPLQRRLVFEELLAHQLSMLKARSLVQREKANFLVSVLPSLSTDVAPDFQHPYRVSAVAGGRRIGVVHPPPLKLDF